MQGVLPLSLVQSKTYNSIIQIKGLTPGYYMKNDKGTITLHGIPDGTYTVHPLFVRTDYDIDVIVTADQTTTETFVIPDMALEFYMVNPAHITDVVFWNRPCQGNTSGKSNRGCLLLR